MSEGKLIDAVLNDTVVSTHSKIAPYSSGL